MALVLSTLSNRNTTSALVTSGNNHHAETVKQNNEQITLLKDVKRLTQQVATLQKQHSSDVTNTAKLVAEIDAAGKEQAQFAYFLLVTENANCANTTALLTAMGQASTPCPAVPNFPGVSP